METAAESRDTEVAEELLTYFVDQGLKESFGACLYVCYDLLRADVVMEVAWRKGLMDFAMPFLIQVTREYTTKVDTLEEANQERTVKEEIKEKQELAPVLGGMPGQPLMLTSSPAWGQGGYAAQPGYQAPGGYGQAPYGGQPGFGGY